MKHKVTRFVIAFALLLVFALHLLGAINFGVLAQLERFAYDERLNLTMPDAADERIVIVDIDEASLAAEGQWPWPRDKVGVLVTRLFDDYGVLAVGFDMVFAEPEETSALQLLDSLLEMPDGQYTELAPLRPYLDTDKQLAQALQGREVVLGYVFSPLPAAGSRQQGLVGALPVAAGIDPMQYSVPWWRARSYTGNLPELQQAAAGGGFFDNPLLDQDGVFRRVPLLQRYGDQVYESLALRLLRAGYQLAEPELVFNGDSTRSESLVGVRLQAKFKGLDGRVEQYVVPTDEKLGMLVNYRGRQGSFAYISATDVLNNRVEIPELVNKIVLVGTSAAGLLDLRNTPVQNVYPGVEVHANIISNILDRDIKEEQGWTKPLEVLILALIAVLFTLLLPRLGPGWDLLLLLAGIAAVVALSFWCWVELNLVVGLAVPIVFLLMLFLLQTSYGLFVENRSKRRLNKIFGQYVPPELVDDLDEEDASLAGEAREMTVLFSDVRGFTGLSEGMAPTELTQLMNELLTPLTGKIHAHRGTIDKYMGDAIMAFWGAPLPAEDHASRAVQAAIEMQVAAAELTQRFLARGWPEVGVGIGLNTGVMNVGNMGSDFRMAYTVLGDAVNLGARLEGLTRTYGVDIIVSEDTRAAAVDFTYRRLDVVGVKGRSQPVTIYEPMPLSVSADIQARIEQFHIMLAAYQRQEWVTALDVLAELQKQESHALYDLYQQRIETFQQSPPGEGWDGVCRFTTK